MHINNIAHSTVKIYSFALAPSICCFRLQLKYFSTTYKFLAILVPTTPLVLQIRVVSRRHRAPYKFTYLHSYLLTYLLTTNNF